MPRREGSSHPLRENFTSRVIVRARSIYQTALETGRSAEETSDAAAAKEIAALWDFIEAEIAATPED